MPKRTGVNGKVYAIKPLDYNGILIEDFWFLFQDGKVTDFGAEKGYDTLSSLVHFDKGSCYLGEVALMPYESPISKSGILLLNTLFDENASCHLALGDAYPMGVIGGADVSEEQPKEAGANHSMTYADFMFGSPDMKIIGVCEDGCEIAALKQGNFALQTEGSGLLSICVSYSEEEELLWKYAVRKEFLVKLYLLWYNLANKRREYL